MTVDPSAGRGVADSVEARLDALHTRYVRLVWCDNANQIRAKAFQRAQLPMHRATGIGISTGQQAVTALMDAPAPGSGLGPVGEVWLRPDWPTLAPVPYAPGHVRVMADLVTRDAAWSCCPRQFLRRVIAAFAEQRLRVQAAFEHEFTVLRRGSDGSVEPIDHALFAATTAMDSAGALIDDITDALTAQGIGVLRYHPESGPGQHEISITHQGPLRAADQAVILRESVHGVSGRHGLIGSFLPKILPAAAGNGCHVHLSIWRDGVNLLPEGGALSSIGRHFVAGILQHLPALMALTAPSPNSYRRIQPHTWSGAYQTWGYDNREAAVRVPSEPAGDTPTHLEVKTVDASANPYLALGAILAAGLDGIIHQPQPPPPVHTDPGDLQDSPRLPETLDAAIARLASDDVLLAALGPELARAYLAVRREESRILAGKSLDEEVTLLLERY